MKRLLVFASVAFCTLGCVTIIMHLFGNGFSHTLYFIAGVLTADIANEVCHEDQNKFCK